MPQEYRAHVLGVHPPVAEQAAVAHSYFDQRRLVGDPGASDGPHGDGQPEPGDLCRELRMDLLRLCWLWYPVTTSYSLQQMIDCLIDYVARLVIVPDTGQVWVYIPPQHPSLGFWT